RDPLVTGVQTCALPIYEQIGEIYSVARESFLGGQKQFQIQAYPFRLTAANLARHRTNPNMPFWKMLKEGSDHFEVTHLEPKVDEIGRAACRERVKECVG